MTEVPASPGLIYPGILITFAVTHIMILKLITTFLIIKEITLNLYANGS